MVNDQQRRDLNDLRAAAHQRDQEQLQFLLKRLLRHLDYYVALAVVMERLHGFLDIFESYYPGETWVRTLLQGIVAFGMAPDDSVAETALSQPFEAPGAGNYIKAVYDVTQAMQDKNTPEARIGYMTSAVVNGIMAELAEAWYGDGREAQWQQVRANRFDPQTGQPSDPEAAQIAYRFWTDPGTAALDTASWLEVADSIEAKLNR